MSNIIIPFRSNLLQSCACTSTLTNDYSILLDGIDDYVDLGSISALTSTSNFSISFWYKRDITPLLQANVMGFWVSGTNVIQFYQKPSDVRFRVDGGYVNNTTPIVQSDWNHFTLVYDGSLTGNVNRAKIYLNGVYETVNEAGTVPVVTNVGGPNFELGTLGGIVTSHSKSNLDEVAFFDYSLNATQAENIYCCGKPTDLSLLATPPTNWYRMGDLITAFPTIPDVGSLASNDGTAFNEPESTMIVPDVP